MLVHSSSKQSYFNNQHAAPTFFLVWQVNSKNPAQYLQTWSCFCSSGLGGAEVVRMGIYIDHNKFCQIRCIMKEKINKSQNK